MTDWTPKKYLKNRNKNAIKSLRILYFGKCLDCGEGGVVSIDGMR